MDEPGSAPEIAAAPDDTDVGEGESTTAVDIDVPLEEPASYRPLVAAAVLRPANVEATGLLTLIIRAKTAPGWHIYAANQPAGTSQPTRLELELPEGIEPSGDWIYPVATEGHTGSKGQFIYEGEFSFQRRLRVRAEALPGPLKVNCAVHYQACDPFSCRPPDSLKLEAGADVIQKSPST